MDNFCVDTIIIWRVIGEIIHVIRLVIPVIIVIFGIILLKKVGNRSGPGLIINKNRTRRGPNKRFGIIASFCV